MFKLMVSLASLLVLTACAGTPKPAGPKPVIRSIAIVPATNPPQFSFAHTSALTALIPITSVFTHFDSKAKGVLFNERMLPVRQQLGMALSDGVASALRGHGYQVQVLDGIQRPADDLDNVDYEKVVAQADAVLHVRFTEVGLSSPVTAHGYLPRVNTVGTLFIKGHSDYLYDEAVYYGVDARKDKSWAILADKRFSYADFDTVMSSLESVRNAFETGVGEISKRMSQQIHDSIK
ncbi:MAG: hypothetical protein AD742_18725 [Methylibium sp. NZG]|nr:MAG: hypothetical protein AD742_18725 [Methylibium sp. NZG]